MSNAPNDGRSRLPRYERLTAWQAAHELNLAIHRETVRWPEEHRNSLGQEIRASATAAAVHIVLGSMESDGRGFRRELGMAVGKLARVGSAWRLVQDLGLAIAETWGEIEAMRDHAEKLTRGLYTALGRKGAGTVGK